jgi:putative nucleotidyltransferase with HDIG domain
MSAKHLISRFFGSVSASALTEDETSWVKSQLLETEFELWTQMSIQDQRHAYKVAQRTVELLGESATRPVVAAALLHDIGKIKADLGTFARVMATFAGRQGTAEQVNEWSQSDGWLGQAGTYLRHNEIGAEMLREAGSDELTAKWAYEHELVHTEWTIPSEISDALWKADNAKG